LPGCLADGEWPLHGGLHPLEMRERADPARADGHHLVARDDGNYTGKRSRLRAVYREDARVGVRASHEGHVEHAREDHVVGEDAAAGQEPRGLGPDHALADVAPALVDPAHAGARARAVFRIASTMAWYPVRRQ